MSGVAIVLIFFLVTLVLVGFVAIKLRWRKKLGSKELQYIRSHWVRIIDSFNSYPSQAIMDADKLLDYTLEKHGFTGTLGEKLKKAGPRFSDLDSVWRAHKLRNKFAHELSNVDNGAAKAALQNFKKALNDLGAKL
jgi:hypothetical protein